LPLRKSRYSDEQIAAALRQAEARRGDRRDHPQAWHPNTFGLTFARIAGDAKLPKVRLHDLRHSFASLLLAGGADLKTVSTALGHSTIAVTADTYAHVSPAMLHAAANLDRVVASDRASGG
jgi:integrase